MGTGTNKKRVSYFYHPDCPHHYYGPGHPMKPIRLKLTHHLVLAYNLHKYMDCYHPHPAHSGELMNYFHSSDYIDFLQKISTVDLSKPSVRRQYGMKCHKYNVGPTEDCPAFDGLYEFSQLTAGASIDAAVQLCLQQSDICINWSGGFHHAKKSAASGFCYVNDIVLAICELLKIYARVLYVDIDVHHGDGVEEAFYTTDRVMTLSVHKFGDDFFPGTGDLCDIGAKDGIGYSLNVPLHNGITDDTYFHDIFKPVFDKIIEIYQPGAIFLQCGADSLAADKLGTFNLTTQGHAKMVEYVKSQDIPTLIAGGGGYTIRNVARVWCYETAVLVDQQKDISNDIPFHDYFEYYAPTYDLHLMPNPTLPNLNTRAELDTIRSTLLEQLHDLQGAPSVSMQYVPPLYEYRDDIMDEEESDDNDNDDNKKKMPKRKRSKQHPAEFYDNHENDSLKVT